MIPAIDVDLGPGVAAFFTTRAGGVSTGAHAELNLGLNVEDEPQRVRVNLGRVADRAGAPLALGRQVHGAEVLQVRGAPRADDPLVGTADALVTVAGGVALAVVVADCVPVLLADPQRRVVGTVHAGRGGLLAVVVPRAIEAMRALGAEELRAAVGPAVCGRCYEVPAAMRDEVDCVVPGTASTTSWGTPALDLPAGVLAQLTDAGVQRVEHVAACTFTDERFYSHRAWSAGGERRGRFAGVVRLG